MGVSVCVHGFVCRCVVVLLGYMRVCCTFKSVLEVSP